MNPVELAAALFGVLYVILAVRSNALCWIAGIASAVLYIVFDLQLKYFQDAILQTYYVVAGFYGWYLWTRISEPSPLGGNGKLTIVTYSISKLFPFLLLGTVLSPVFGYLFSKLGNAYSYIDAFTAVFSFIATYLTAKKIIENWISW